MTNFLLGGDLPIQRLGFGTMRLVNEGAWGEPANREQMRNVLRRTVSLGVNFIDTADAYGPEVLDVLAQTPPDFVPARSWELANRIAVTLGKPMPFR